jgi:hypothetical protein
MTPKMFCCEASRSGLRNHYGHTLDDFGVALLCSNHRYRSSWSKTGPRDVFRWVSWTGLVGTVEHSMPLRPPQSPQVQLEVRASGMVWPPAIGVLPSTAYPAQVQSPKVPETLAGCRRVKTASEHYTLRRRAGWIGIAEDRSIEVEDADIPNHSSAAALAERTGDSRSDDHFVALPSPSSYPAVGGCSAADPWTVARLVLEGRKGAAVLSSRTRRRAARRQGRCWPF